MFFFRFLAARWSWLKTSRVVGSGFLLVAILKALDGDFVAYVHDSFLLPMQWAKLLAWIVIALEGIGGLLMFTRETFRAGWIILSSPASMFLLFHVAAVVLGDIASCQCTGGTMVGPTCGVPQC